MMGKNIEKDYSKLQEIEGLTYNPEKNTLTTPAPGIEPGSEKYAEKLVEDLK